MPPKAKEVKKCDVVGCEAEAERSVSPKKVGSILKLNEIGRGRAHLCKTHYREFKKATKKDRQLDRVGWK